MRLRPTALAALLLALAAPWPAAGQRLAGAQAAPELVKDHRDLKLFRRELVDDRRSLDLLRARLERLTTIYAARVLDVRAVGELHARVQEELLRDARARRLRTLPSIQDATLGRAAVHPQDAPPLAPRGWTAADGARVERIPAEWAALKDRVAPVDVEARYKLLAERVALARFKLAADQEAFRWLGGDVEDLDPEEDEVGGK